MAKKLLKILLTMAALTVFCCALQAGAAYQNRPYEAGGNIKIYNHVVYREKSNGYTVIDFFDTEEAAQSATQITVRSKIGNKSVTAIDTMTAYASIRTYKKVTKITLPSTIKSIGKRAFAGFSGVKSLTLPASLKTIGQGAFQGMTSLTSITLPKKVSEIADNLFYGCTKLQKVTVKGNVTDVGTQAFYNCKKLTSLSCFGNLDYFGEAAFHNTGLTEIKLYRGAYFQSGVFSGCKNLQKVTFVSSKSPYSILVSSAMFDGCTKLKTLNFPTSVETLTLGYRALQGCVSLQKLILPKKATRVSFEGAALRDCTSLNYIENKIVLNSIGDYCFTNCNALKTYRLSENTTFVGTWAFYGCKNLKSVKILFSDASVLKSGFVKYLSDDCTMYVKTNAMKTQVLRYGFDGDVIVRSNLV